MSAKRFIFMTLAARHLLIWGVTLRLRERCRRDGGEPMRYRLGVTRFKLTWGEKAVGLFPHLRNSSQL